MSALHKISMQEDMIRNLKSEIIQNQKGHDSFKESMNKKMSSIEMILQNQLKIGAEDSFANYINLNDDMNYSLIKKQNKDKDESGIYEYNVLEGLMNMDKRLTQTMNKNSLTPVEEIKEIPGKPNQPKVPVKKTHKKIPVNTTQAVHEVTGNSFFNDVSLGLKKKEITKPKSLGQTSKVISKPNQNTQLNKIPEEQVPAPQTKGYNMYQMQNAKPNPNAAPENELTTGTKIKRENVTKDLNCTINDESILDYMIDENGYLMTEKGDLVYDDDGKVVKLTDEEIDKFKESEGYEEVEC